ncbi:MAG TPA: chemotaxis protein CheW [Bryobacteraceae bacterium]|nr:chemotaxis protein CheW [Bryobacteraceae bacterium]
MTETGKSPRNPVLRAAASEAAELPRALAFRLPGVPLQRIAVGVSAKQLMGVQPAESFPPWPADPPRWLGVIQWNGRQVPVVDLAACFGLGSSDYRMARRLVFLRCARRGAVIAVPSTGDVTQVENSEDVRPVSMELSLPREFTRGVFHFGSELLLVPDLDAIWEQALEPAAAQARRAG